jgi:hypothetical protein
MRAGGREVELPLQVLKVLQQARGGILFIDEAYGLDPSESKWCGYAAEAVEALVGHITDKEFKGNVLVIMSGYSDRMERMFTRANPGFRSRFDKVRVDFPAWTGEQAAAAAVDHIEADGKTLTSEARIELYKSFEEMARLPSWASARDVFETVLPAMYSKRATRMVTQARLLAADTATGPAADVASASGPAKESSGRRRQTTDTAREFPYEASDVTAAFAYALNDSGGLAELGSSEALRAAVAAENVARRLLVVQFFTGPYQCMAPAFKALHREFGGVATFAKAVIDQGDGGAAKEHGVRAAPTVLCFHSGMVVERFEGADPQHIRQFIVTFLAKARQHPIPSNGSANALDTHAQPTQVLSRPFPLHHVSLFQLRCTV